MEVNTFDMYAPWYLGDHAQLGRVTRGYWGGGWNNGCMGVGEGMEGHQSGNVMYESTDVQNHIGGLVVVYRVN